MPELIEKIQPDRIFIATEGSLGLAARTYCLFRGLPFVTSYTTRWPEYFKAHLGFPPLEWGYTYMRWFHDPAHVLMVATPSLKNELEKRGFRNVVRWSRGVDTTRFRPLPKTQKNAFLPHLPKPFYTYLGRISREKNIEAFLDLSLPGTKIVIGDGSDLTELREKYPDAVFTGGLQGLELANTLGSGDVLVFPSKTDTFGLVMLEGLAAGLPVVSFDVTGPHDVLRYQDKSSPVGYLAQNDSELLAYCLEAGKKLETGEITPESCHAYVGYFSWESSVNTLVEALPKCCWKEILTLDGDVSISA